MNGQWSSKKSNSDTYQREFSNTRNVIAKRRLLHDSVICPLRGNWTIFKLVRIIFPEYQAKRSLISSSWTISTRWRLLICCVTYEIINSGCDNEKFRYWPKWAVVFPVRIGLRRIRFQWPAITSTTKEIHSWNYLWRRRRS